MEQKKLKMNAKKFNTIWTVILCLVLAIAIAVTYAMNFFSVTMETQLGRGERVETVPEGAELLDTNFYDTEVADLDAVTDAAALAIAEEGEVLLKNNGVLPLAEGSAVTPFGYRYISPVYGGTGSGNVNTSSPRIVTAVAALNSYFDVNADMEALLQGSKARGMSAEGYEEPNESGGFEGATAEIIEYESSIYTGHEAGCAGTTGIVFIGRIGGEGRDVCADVEGSPIYGTGYTDGTAHQLALSEDEKEMIRFAKANCDSVVVIINSSNVVEIADLADDNSDISADAILWIGGPGGQGFEAMAEILCGKVNPSGKTVDTWMTDLMSAPSMSNFGNFEYDNTYLLTGGYPNPVGDATEMNFLEYEEGIYVGYRYYETVDATGGTFTVFGESGKSYEDAVVYPFGYGLSYGTDFAQEITSFTEDDTNVYLTVKVTNNGTQTGKDVVQIYYNPPYTTLDAQEGIEKSTANLIAFDKTGDIAPGASQEVGIVITKEDLASYSYKRQNSDGTTGAYVLEAGDYIISANKNAHEQYDAQTLTIAETIWYGPENPRQSEIDAQSALDEEGNPTGTPAAAEADASATFTAATNKFQDMSDHMESTDQMTRQSGTLMDTTTTPTAADKANVPDYELTDNGDGTYTLAQTDLDNNHEIGNTEDSKIYVPESEKPTTAADFTVALSSLRGKSYYDPLWEELLDQLNFDDHDLYVALTASYDQTAEIASVNKPATVDFDGPQGIVGSILDDTEYTAYPSEPIIAATFNTNLTYEMGVAVGKEAADAGVNTWYAPATNIHRSPFSGRNFEYYSEDPFLSGKMLTAEVNGCSSQGLIVTIKHFALNDEETYSNDRSRVSIWANEQAIREIYLKPFEMCVKDARMEVKYVDDNGDTVSHIIRGTSAVMGCMNYWGTQWGGARYSLLTETLRGEWGFQGFVVTDMVMNAGSNSVDQCLRAGSDTWMAWGEAFTTLIEDTESATAITAIRKAVKNMCYSIVNSRAFEGVAPGTTFSYKMSPWRVALYTGDAIAAIFIVVMIAVMVLRTKKSKEHPELFKAPKEKQAAK
jgi:beta-glucosidase